MIRLVYIISLFLLGVVAVFVSRPVDQVPEAFLVGNPRVKAPGPAGLTNGPGGQVAKGPPRSSNPLTNQPVDTSAADVENSISTQATQVEPARSLDADLHEARVQFVSAEASLNIAQQNEKIRVLQQRSKLASVERKLDLLRMDRETYRHGEAVRRRDELHDSVKLGEQRADLAEARLHWSERLAEKGLVSQFGLESDRAATDEAQADFQANEKELEVFQESAFQRQLAIRDRQVQLAETEVERVQREERTLEAQQKANITLQQSARQMAHAELTQLEEQHRKQQSDLPLPDDNNGRRRPVRSNATRSLSIDTIVEHGSRVDTGQVLVQLDTTQLDEDLQQNEHVQTRLAIERDYARQDLALVETQNELDRSQSQLAIKAAKLASVDYLEGTFPQQEQLALDKIDEHQDLVEATRRRLDWSERVVKKGYLPQMQLDTDRFDLENQKHLLVQAKHELRILQQHTYGRELAALEFTIQQAEADDERVTTLAEARLAKRHIKLQAIVAKLRLHKMESQRLEKVIAKCRIVAPSPGRVLHELPPFEDVSFQLPAVGSLVQPNQFLLTFVDETSRLNR
ncbi:MAG: hypothetical protein CMJ62_19785 [Planctomycetaceae bacterium]|nr:hypothetical protein [Planctomycetaceae bacterium]